MYLEMTQDVYWSLDAQADGWTCQYICSGNKVDQVCFLLVYCYIVTRGPESTVEWSNFSIICGISPSPPTLPSPQNENVCYHYLVLTLISTSSFACFAHLSYCHLIHLREQSCACSSHNAEVFIRFIALPLSGWEFRVVSGNWTGILKWPKLP